MNSESDLDADLALCLLLADAASVLSLTYFRRQPRQWSKADGSLVTEGDFAVEDALRARLGVERPNDAVLGEERGETGAGGRRWIIDGIDGTVQFAAGTVEWGTLIALEVDGRVVVGVCDQPAKKRRYWAVRGRGAFSSHASSTAGTKLKVSAQRDLRLARSFVPKGPPDKKARAVAAAVSGATTPEPLTDHPAIQVATGGYDLALFLSGGPWDLAAPALIVEEAGGRFTNIAGRNEITSGNGVFSNGLVHDDVLRVISRA